MTGANMPKALLISTKFAIALGYLTSILFALFALNADSGAMSALCFFTSTGLAVINLPLLFPWPRKNSENSTALAMASLLFGGSLSLVLFLGGMLGVSPLADWRAAILLFGGTSAANLAILDLSPR